MKYNFKPNQHYQHYSTFSELRKIINRLKWYGYQREGKMTYTFRTSKICYVIQLVKDCQTT
jgi:hypothetical protein